MYTQCPECESIFEITATDLAVAGGFVRCGQCSSSFDALNSLSDNPDSIKASAGVSKAKAALKKVKSKARSTVAIKKATVPAKLARRKKTSRAKPKNFVGSAARIKARALADDVDSDVPADVVLLPDAENIGKQDNAETGHEASPHDTDAHSETKELQDDGLEALASIEPVVSDDVTPSSDIDEETDVDEEIDAEEESDSDQESEAEEESDSDQKSDADEASGDDAETDDTENPDTVASQETADSAAVSDPERDKTPDDEPASTPTESDDSSITDDASEVLDDTVTDKAATGSIESDADEILLDDTYQSPYSADDEEYFDDEQIDAEDDAFEATPVPDTSADELASELEDESPNDSLDEDPDENEDDDSSENQDDDNLESFFDEDQETALADEPLISSDADTGEVDESVLFALPLPELTALESGNRGLLPEKLEGGEAAHDPSAQTPISRDEPAQPQTTLAQPPSHLPGFNDAYDAEDARDLKAYLKAPTNRLATAAWLGGSVLMAILLLAQFVHRHRGDLVTHPRLGPVVSSIYDTVGADLRPNWQINHYEVVGQARLFLMPNDEAEEQSDDAASAIRFVAIISNGANRPQPAPMVRLTLRDRWGDATGARDFTPPEYLADRALIGRMLEPGQRLRVVLNLRDQGSEAVGFDFDLCLPDGAGTLRCTSEDAG